jgi:hypothetical protein
MKGFLGLRMLGGAEIVGFSVQAMAGKVDRPDRTRFNSGPAAKDQRCGSYQ